MDGVNPGFRKSHGNPGRTRIHRPLPPASAGGEKWRDRYFALKAGLKDAPRIISTELGSLRKGVNPFERYNLWLLYTALAWGVDQVCFICLWNGSGGDGPVYAQRHVQLVYSDPI